MSYMASALKSVTQWDTRVSIRPASATSFALRFAAEMHAVYV